MKIKGIIKMAGPNLITFVLIMATISLLTNYYNRVGLEYTIGSIVFWVLVKQLALKEFTWAGAWKLLVNTTGIISLLAFAFINLGMKYALLGLAIYVLIIAGFSIGKNYRVYDYYTTWAAGRIRGSKEDFNYEAMMNGQEEVQRKDGQDSNQGRTRSSTRQPTKPVGGSQGFQKTMQEVRVPSRERRYQREQEDEQGDALQRLREDLRNRARKREEDVK